MTRRVNHFFILWLTALTGCGLLGGTGEVSGTVLLDGAPTSGFQISFTSVKEPDLIIRGIVGDAGKFRLSRGRGKVHIPAGEYLVTLTPLALGESTPQSRTVLPSRYMNVDQTDLRQVVARGKNELKIDLKSQP